MITVTAVILAVLASQVLARQGQPVEPVQPQPNPQVFGGEDAWNIILPYFFSAELQQYPDLAHQFNLILDWHPLGGTPSEPGSDYIAGTFVLSSSNGQHTGTDFELNALQTVDIPLTQDMIDDGVEAFTLVIGQMIHSNQTLELDMLIAGTAITYSQGETRLVIGASFNNSTQGRMAQSEVLQMLSSFRTLPTTLCSVQTVALTNCERNMNNQATSCSNQNFAHFLIAMSGCGGVATFSCPACFATPAPATPIPCAFCLGAWGCMGVATKNMLSDSFKIAFRRRDALDCCCLYAETLHSGGTWMNPACSFVCP